MTVLLCVESAMVRLKLEEALSKQAVRPDQPKHEVCSRAALHNPSASLAAAKQVSGALSAPTLCYACAHPRSI